MSSASATTVFVSGLDEGVSEELLYAAFVPFGELKTVQVARDFVKNKTKGYGFVEFALEEDAAASIENMDGAELLGKTIHCKEAKVVRGVGGIGGGGAKAVWASEEWIQKELEEGEGDM